MSAPAPRPALTTKLDDAVHALIGPRPTTHTDTDGDTHNGYRSSVYAEIRAELAARQGASGTLRPRSLPPVWVDGLDWLTEVDTIVATWCPDAGQSSTIGRLNQLADTRWAPEHYDYVQAWIADLHRWAESGKAMLEPVHRWELVAACPACGIRTVHRPDTSGEPVRQAALQITSDGCICQACRTTWAPTHYRLLAAALGCELPTGVLE